MNERPRVALFVESSSEFGRLVLRGIRRYLQAHSAWSIYLQQRDLDTRLPVWLKNWQGDGIISRSTTPEFVSLLKKSGIPTVDLTDRYGEPDLPRIWVDHAAIGRMAAKHLLERQFRQFAFAGFKQEYWSEIRYQGFLKELERYGYPCHKHESSWEFSRGQSWDDELESLVQWLKSLPQPIGIMACNDIMGQRILDACCEIELAVPEQVAVIGCDNDSLRCELCDPPMSSVVPNAERIGYQAAELLDRLMQNQPVQNLRIDVAPLEVETRKSTDILAIDDPDIALAVRLIREQATSGLKIEELLKHIPVSRSTLERGVRKYLKRSPQAEIRRVQLKLACELLSQTDMTLPEIAQRCGFVHPEYFSVVFRRELGIPPGKYREFTPH